MAQCLFPITVKNNDRKGVLVPCGNCLNCKLRRASTWSFRLMQESKRSTSSLFITLTYDTNNVPITNRGFMSINTRDLQLFFKRLRKANKEKLKYYAVGEYGGKTMRPHYHIILYNADVITIDTAWNLGQVHYGTLTEASVGYTLKYISKPKKIPLHKNDDRKPEFSLMSKHLGDNYITKNMVKWHLADINNRIYVNLPDNKKESMPRYYKNLIYDENTRLQVANHFAQKFAEKFIKERDEHTPLQRKNDLENRWAADAKPFIHSNKI